MYHLHQFLRGRQRDMPQETIQVLDVVLRESPSWNYVTVSRSFFSTTFGHRGDIGEGLECWRGYYQSLRPTQMGLSLNIDISATSFFKPVTVIKFVEEFLNIRDTSRPLSDRDRVKIKKALRGVRIETSHQLDQIRRYKITGITPIPMSQLIFPIDEMGTRQTVVQYFWDKYNYRLKYGSWPCLQVGSDSRPVYLPMEVCKIVEGQRYSKKLNDKQVTNILRATCKRPQEREQSIRDMVLHNKYAEDKFAQEFGIKVTNDLVSVPARVLPPPMLRYHDSGREKTCAPSVGQWNMINKKMINGGTIDNWTCLNFSRMRPEEVQRFCMDLTHMCNATGMSVNPRPFVEVKSAAPNHIENALRDVHRRATQMLAQQGTGNQLQLLIVILPDVSCSYGKIKRVCETEIGIVSQCCLPRHASRPNKQYLENVALKINVKVGGRNTVLERAFARNGIPFVSEVPTIIFGADVTPIPPGEDSASSTAGVVASMDWPEITKYRGLVSAQPHQQEIIEDLFTVSKDPHKGHNVNGGMIRKKNQRPESTIFYRDGVSEGQFSHVLLHEMDGIRKACASLEGYQLSVTSVAVQKRHHTGLFPEVHGTSNMTEKSGSIPAVPSACSPPSIVVDECFPGRVSVRISIDRKSTTLSAEIGSSLGSVVSPFLLSEGLELSDCFFECGVKPLGTHTLIMEDMTVKATGGLKGGKGTLPPISFEDFISCNLDYPSGFFEVIDVPRFLRRPDMHIDYIVCLGPNGLHVLNLVLKCLEQAHRLGYSYNGHFGIKDFEYDTNSEKLFLNVQCDEICQESYINDLFQVVLLVFEKYLMYEDEWQLPTYPMHLTHLVRSIEQLDPEGETFKSVKMRSLVFKHPGTWRISTQVEVITSLIMKYHKGFFKRVDRIEFERVMKSDADMDSSCRKWQEDVDDFDAPSEMKRMFNHVLSDGSVKTFRNDYLGRLDYSRCALNHSKASTVQMLAALYMYWDDQLPEIQMKLTVEFKGSSFRGHMPSRSSDSGVADPHGKSKKRTRTGSDEPARKRMRLSSRVPNHPPRPYHKDAFGSSGYILVSKMARREEIDIFEIFGFTRIPRG